MRFTWVLLKVPKGVGLTTEMPAAKGQRHSPVFSSSEVGRKNTTFQQVEFYIEVLK